MGDGFRILENLLRFTGLRHNVITSNIANVDTPGYRAKDISFDDLLERSMLELRLTSERHINPVKIEEGFLPVERDDGTWKDGNNVELDREMAALTENALLYQAGLNMLSAKIRMFKNALRRQ